MPAPIIPRGEARNQGTFSELWLCVAARVGFEPTESCPSAAFKAAALVHYAISPCGIHSAEPILGVDKVERDKVPLNPLEPG